MQPSVMEEANRAPVDGGPAGAPPPRRRLRLFLARLAVMGVSTLIALLLAEGVVRFAAPQQLIDYRADMYEPSDVYGHQQVANARTEVNTGERRVRFRTDEEGFRVGDAGPVDADTRVLLIGDSFVQAIQVEYDQSYAGLLSASLAQALRRPVAVRNTGVPGWDVNHYLIRARNSFAKERYRAAVVSVTMENDVVPQRVAVPPRRETTMLHPLRVPRSLAWPEIVDAVLYPVNDFLEVRSHLFILARRQLHTVRMAMGLSPLNLPAHYYRAAADSAAWGATASALIDLARLSREQGTPIVFVLLPSDYQVDRATFEQYVRGFGLDPSTMDMDQPNRVLGEALRGAGLEVIDALPALREAQARGEQLYGTVDPHLSPEGHRVVHRLLHPVVARMLAEPTPTANAPR